MDNEYTKMCDCEEVQGKWEPKLGDRYIYTRTGLEVLLHDMKTFKECWPVNPFGGKFIFLPRIEDLLGWLGKGMDSLRNWQNEQWMVSIKNSKGDIEWASDSMFDFPEKAFLEAFMVYAHGLTWNGEAWV